MHQIHLKIWMIILFMSSLIDCYSQRHTDIIIHTKHCNKLIAGLDNFISILPRSNVKGKIGDVTAFLSTEYNYYYEKEPIKLEVKKQENGFKIRPDSVGMVVFRIKLGDHIIEKQVRAKPITATPRLAKYKANSNIKISANELKFQEGIYVIAHCSHFRCLITDFELVRVSFDTPSSKITNKGGRFEETTIDLLNQAKSGDLYIFRNINYSSPGTTRIQRTEDMVFEIK